MITDPHFHLPKPEPYQRLGSGDGEREALMTRQMPYEPLPASVLFALVIVVSPLSGILCSRSEVPSRSRGVLLNIDQRSPME